MTVIETLEKIRCLDALIDSKLEQERHLREMLFLSKIRWQTATTERQKKSCLWNLQSGRLPTPCGSIRQRIKFLFVV